MLQTKLCATCQNWSHMALTMNSLLCNLPYGRKLLIMQISIASHFIFICVDGEVVILLLCSNYASLSAV